MTETKKTLDPWTAATALLVLLCAGFVCFDQYYYWSTQSEYSFGYIVPLFVAFIIYDRWPKILAYLAGSSGGGASRNGVLSGLVTGLFALGLLFAFALFTLGGAIRISQGPGNLASLFIAVGFGGVFLGLAYFTSASPAREHAPTLRERLGFTFLFLFPSLVWLISAPMVMYLDSDVKLILMHWVSVIVFNVFDFLGLSIMREGNVLILPMGTVGVADACSGVRSLTGCIFAGSFLAAVFIDRFWKKCLLITAAILLAFITNIFRSLFLTGWAYAKGPAALDEKVFTAIAGGMTLHDFTGYAVLGVTCILLIMMLPLFTFTIVPPGQDDEMLPENENQNRDHA